MRNHLLSTCARAVLVLSVLLLCPFPGGGCLFAATPNFMTGSNDDSYDGMDPGNDVFKERDPAEVNFCLDEVGFGPLRLQSQSPFQSLRFGMSALAPSTIRKGEWELFLSGTLSNVWVNTEDRYLMDYEAFASQAVLSYGISNRVRVEIGYDERRLFGGFLDGFIVGFHDTFGIDQDGRDQAPNGDVNIDIRDDDGNSVLSNNKSDTFSRGLEITVQHNVTCGSHLLPAFSYAILARRELKAGPLERERPVDIGISLAVSKKIYDIYLYLAGGYFFYGNDTVGDVKLKNQQKSGLIAFEWRYRETQSLLLQFLASEGQAEHLDSFSDDSYEVTLGWKWEMYPQYVLEMGLIENVIIYDNSPDLGVHLGMSHRF